MSAASGLNMNSDLSPANPANGRGQSQSTHSSPFRDRDRTYRRHASSNNFNTDYGRPNPAQLGVNSGNTLTITPSSIASSSGMYEA